MPGGSRAYQAVGVFGSSIGDKFRVADNSPTIRWTGQGMLEAKQV